MTGMDETPGIVNDSGAGPDPNREKPVVARGNQKRRKARIGPKPKKPKKNNTLLYSGIVAVLLLGMMFGCGPRKGSLQYGVCKTFLELNVRYPETIRLRSVEQFGTNVRLYYAETDPFGEHQLNLFTCDFRSDSNYGFALQTASINRREIPVAQVERFNQGIPAILANPPDLRLPRRAPDELENFQKNK